MAMDGRPITFLKEDWIVYTLNTEIEIDGDQKTLVNVGSVGLSPG